MRVLDAFWPRGATWSGHVISSPPGPSGGPSKTHLLPGGEVLRVHRARTPVPPRLPRFVTPLISPSIHSRGCRRLPTASPPLCVVARGAGAAGPVLLACRQWDPLRLARSLPCPGVGAWRSARLLPWRVQCPVRVCAALAAGSGGSGRYLVVCLSRFPRPAPHVPRCVWRAVPSGCPLPSLAGTPFHAVCAFRELGPVALLVVPACPLRVCVLALRCVRPPPWVVWRAHLARSRHWALVGPFHVVRAPLRVLLRSLAPSGVLGGGRSGPGSALPGLPCTPCGGCVPRGWWGAVPGGGWPATVVRGVWCQALSLPRPPIVWGGQPGYRDPCFPGAVGAGVGTQHRFRSVRRCRPALLAVGVAERRPWGGAFHRCEGRLRSGAVPLPTAHPLGGLLGCITHMLWARACGCGGPSLPLWPACPLGAACRGGGGGPSPGGWPATVARGVWCQALSLLLPPFLWGGRPGSCDPCPGCGRCGRGDPAPAPQCAPLRASSARCRAGGRASPGGVPSTIMRGVWCQALSLPRPPVLWSGQPGFRNPCVPGAVGAGLGAQRQPHSVRPCGPAFLPVGVAEGRPRGRCLPPL